MPVYDANGNDLLGIVYDAEGNRLYQAYDADGNELINGSSWVDDLPDSGYSFTDGTNVYGSKLLFDFGAMASFQSVTLANNKYYRASSDVYVYPYDSSLNALSMITLPSTGGHKNDGCYYNNKIYWIDGTADAPGALYVWNISANTLTQVTIPISDNANGSKRMYAGICNTDTDGIMYLVSRDQYNNSDIAHQTGDKMCVFSYNIANNTVSLVASFDWDCVYVQGCTYVDGLLYVACNTQTTGSASNYTGITIKVIDTSTWQIIKTLTCSGDFEPEGCDNITIGSKSYIWTGVGKWHTTEKVVIFEV